MKKKLLKERTKRMSNSKGITLVALIITIVVLLILAVVAIGTVRNSGIIGHAQNAASGYNQAKNNEISMLEQYKNEIEKNTPGGQTDEVIWGEATIGETVLLTYIGSSKNLIVTTDKIKVEEGTLNTNDFSFSGNNKIKEVDISNYNNIMFLNNKNIETIDFGNVLTSNNLLAFNLASNLKEVKGLDGITAFDSYAFNGCENLESIVLPDSLTKMPSLSGCSS